MDRKELMQQVKDGSLHGVYLFEGTEENIKAASLAAVRKALLPEGMEELNESVMDAPATDVLIAAAETLPFLADKRLVVVREHPALMRSEADERLLSYIAQSADSCVLIFYARGKVDARKKLYKAIAKSGAVVSFMPLTESELNTWIIRKFAALGKQCAGPTAGLLAFTVGSDTALLTGEIEKLASLVGERSGITDDDVRAVATRSIECTVFEMVDAVVAGQEGRAFGLMRDMLTAGQERLGILAMLLRQYRMLQHVKIMQYEKKGASQIADGLGVKSFAADKYIRQARSLSGAEVRDAVNICLDTEFKVKSGHMNQDGALEAAMLELFALRHARTAH